MSGGGGITFLPAFPHSYGRFPADGPLVLPITLSWASIGNQFIDLVQEHLMNSINNIQGAWIDNSKNTGAFTMTLVGLAAQNIVIPASKIIMLPLFVPPGGFQATVSSTVAASQQTTLLLVNVPIPYGEIQ